MTIDQSTKKIIYSYEVFPMFINEINVQKNNCLKKYKSDGYNYN